MLFESAAQTPMRRILLAIAICASLAASAQNPPSQRELNGILLGQRRSAMVAEFGQPFDSRPHEEDSGIQEAYAVSPDQKTYMACEFPKSGDERSTFLQLTGEPSPKTLPFLGLRLGDSKELVIKTLGKPSRVTIEKDFPVSLYEYDDRNYSVEIDRKGLLYSIRIVAGYGFPESPTTPTPNITRFRDALKSGNLDRLLDTISADLALYPEGRPFNRGARSELSQPDSKFAATIARVRAILSDPMVEGDPNIRIREHESPQVVFKFPPKTGLEEIVYHWEAGAWRVYEIQLHE